MNTQHLTNTESADQTSTDNAYPGRRVAVEEVAHAFGDAIAEARHASGIAQAFVALAIKHGLAGTGNGQPTAAIVLSAFVETAVLTDRVFDSEAAMAARGVHQVLGEHYGDHVELTGEWLPGETMLINGSRVILTGQACPNCPMPLALGSTGTHCIDVEDCGWAEAPL